MYVSRKQPNNKTIDIKVNKHCIKLIFPCHNLGIHRGDNELNASNIYMLNFPIAKSKSQVPLTFFLNLILPQPPTLSPQPNEIKDIDFKSPLHSRCPIKKILRIQRFFYLVFFCHPFLRCNNAIAPCSPLIS